MLRWWPWLGVGAELLAALLIWRPLWPGSFLLALVLHSFAAYALAVSFWHQLPRRYKLPVNRSLYFMIAVLWMLPVFGAIGLYTGLVIALRTPRHRLEQGIRTINLAELPFSPPVIYASPPYSQGALRQIVRYAERPLKRLKAVMATRHMAANEAVPVWTLAMRDRVDDVRLLAYAMMDSNEKKLTERITAMNEELNDIPVRMRAPHYKTLAALCWELVYHGLVQGAVRAHWLNTAIKHIEQALQMAPDGSSHLLHARMLMRLDNIDAAQAELRRAEQAGVDQQVLLPYLAEVAFRQRRFAEVKNLLAASTKAGELGRDFAQVKAWWAQ